jgi:hypothetical protein
MCQKASLILVLLVLVAGACWAQAPGLEDSNSEATYEEAAPAEAEAPAAAPNSVAAGDSVVELAQFISTYVSDTGQLPDLVQVRTQSGNLRVLSAAEAFVLIARAVDLWRANEEMPETVPMAPAEVTRPDIDPEDVPQGAVDVESGQEIPTEGFLEQTAATVRWVDQLQKVPTAVWVEGTRLSAAQYMAGLAICLEYAYEQGELEDTVFLPAYAPPSTWAVSLRTTNTSEATGEQSAESTADGSDSSAEVTDESGAGEEAATGEATSEGSEAGNDGSTPAASLRPMTPMAEEESAPAPEEKPKLWVFPRPGDRVSGVVELVASYRGPAASFVIFSVDGATRAIMNIPPYSFRWDASALPPGTHTVRVQVIGAENVTLLDQVNAYIVTEPKAKQPPKG